MTIISVAQRKGGVGKTAIAVCLAGELSRRDYAVALIDSDPQRSACHWAEMGCLEFPVYEIGLENTTEGNWAHEVRSVQADIVVIDTAPSERQLGASISLANLILVPCTASGLDIEATERTLAIVRTIRGRRRSPLAVILVPNRVDRRTLEGRQLETELGTFGEMVGPTVGYRSAFVRAFAAGQSVADSAPGELADREIKTLCDFVVRELPKNG
jgi:chromosome partitioning protein